MITTMGWLTTMRAVWLSSVLMVLACSGAPTGSDGGLGGGSATGGSGATGGGQAIGGGGQTGGGAASGGGAALGGGTETAGGGGQSGGGTSANGGGADAGGGGGTSTGGGGTSNPDAGCAGRVPLTYEAATDRLPHMATPPTLGDAGTVVLDPTYGTRMLRLTDGSTLSYRVANEFWGNDWNTDSTLFYIQASNGGVHYYRFDPQAFSAVEITKPNLSGGGFSRTSPNLLIGLYGLTLASYDFTTQMRTDIVALTTLVPGATGNALGAQQARNGLIASVFGGPEQDMMPYLITYDPVTTTHHVIDVTQSTLDGVALGTAIGGGLHSFKLDASGRYLFFGVTGGSASNWLYDVQLGTVTTLPSTGVVGSGAWIHNGAGAESYDWAVSDYATPTTTTPLINPLPMPLDSNASSDMSWENAIAGTSVPLIVETMRRPADVGPWREWDNELVAVRTDGVQTTVWRFAHHFNSYAGTIYSDNFYYLYKPRVSQDGHSRSSTRTGCRRWAPTATGNPRTDAFIVELKNGCGP